METNFMNDNHGLKKSWIDNIKVQKEAYYKDNPDSLVFQFENELREQGFVFEIFQQAIGFMPKNKKILLPIAIKYYREAKRLGKENEQNYFLDFFHFKGFEEVVPMLLQDFESSETNNLTRWFIADCLYQIRSKAYINRYIEIVLNPAYGINRQMIILLLGKLKDEAAIPTLIGLLDDEEVRIQTICALGDYKREEFRPYFERFVNENHSGWRKNAKAALKKLEKN